jgi:hypothetical protein
MSYLQNVISGVSPSQKYKLKDVRLSVLGGAMEIWSNASWCLNDEISAKNSPNEMMIHAVFTGVRSCLLGYGGRL